MVNPGVVLGEANARHLLRRTGFGADPVKVTRFSPLTRGQAADLLLSFRPSVFKPLGRSIRERQVSWLKYMMTTQQPLQEKLVLFWHDHFATSNAKVENDLLMALQNALLRKYCRGNLKDFVKAINKNAAMMEFLDTVRNGKDQPNENYARELQELFTLGARDINGNQNYGQADVRQIARAFTGWDYNYPSGTPVFDTWNHDINAVYEAERGAKVIYGPETVDGQPVTFGQFATPQDFSVDAMNVPNEGAPEIDRVVDIIFQHRDSDAKNTVARFVTGKLWIYFAQPHPKRPVPGALKQMIDDVVSFSSFDTQWNLTSLLHAMFSHDNFYDTAAPATYTSGTLKSVKWPVDYVVSTLRLLKVSLRTRYGYTYIEGGNYSGILELLSNMGQVLLEPPSVFGWDWETAWLSSATLLARYTFARDLTSARAANGNSPTAFRPTRMKFVDITLTDPGAIVDAAAKYLGIKDQLTTGDRDALISYLTDGNPGATVNLTDYTVRNTKLHGLFALLLESPAYQIH